jgi:hydroxymethylpyrimidine pyrophosphatase-like HAD family hydrolase
MKIPREAVVGVGDAENDHAFLRACGLGVAVANALDALKQTADAVTKGSRGAGVVELIEEILRADEKREPAVPAGGGRAGSASA